MKSPSLRPQLVEFLFAKYHADPKGFRAYLPEVAQVLDALSPAQRIQPSPFGLTEQERARRQQQMRQALTDLGDHPASRETAVRGIEHCAALIEDDSLPVEVSYATLVRLLRAVIGTAPGSVKRLTTVPIVEAPEESVVNHVSLIKGAIANLTWDMRLVSITINPRKVKERRKALRLVGLASDMADDVAQRHDAYLAARDPHAGP